MSKPSVELLTRELEDITTDLLWRQWRAVGGSAVTDNQWNAIVDPEAVVLASLFFAEREPRISDILFSWVEINASLLSAQRLRNAQKIYPREVAERVASFVASARSLHKHPRWRHLSADLVPDDDHQREPRVSRAAQPSNASGSTLLLRLRSAMGVGVKADVLAVLLGRDRPTTVRDLSALLDYTAAGTRMAVQDLARAGFIFDVGGRPSAFVAPENEWQALLKIDQRPRWVSWNHWFALVVELLSLIERSQRKGMSSYALDVSMRELVDRHNTFFRMSAHELEPAAFQLQMGDYPAAIASLVQWAHFQARGAV